MEKGRFYQLKKELPPIKSKGGVFVLLEKYKIDDKFSVVVIGKVHAILLDRVIVGETYEFITDKVADVINNFTEISQKEAKTKIDNTDALLSREIFRR